MSFSPRGAVDLSSLAANRPAGQSVGGPTIGGSEAAGGASFAFDVTEQSIQTVVQGSLDHIVLLLLWSPRSPEPQQYLDRVAEIVNSYAGKLELGRIDIDAQPQLAQAFGVQAVPTLVGLVKGQPVPLLQGTADEAQLRQVLDELVKVAVQNGVTGRAQPAAAAAGVDAQQSTNEPVDDPRYAVADEAFASGDFDTAIAEYEKLRANHPGEDEIAERLAGVKLMKRTHGADLSQARLAAGESPRDIEAQMLVADLDVSGGHIDDAFDRLLGLIAALATDEREPVRERLIELFTVVGSSDPRVAKARRALAAALY